MAKQPPNDYKDPYWTNLSTMMEKKHGLPAGLLVNIVQKGERTNNNLVSSDGAKTVYQIIPSTRRLFLKAYGVDAYASPEGAAEMAALHLKESLRKKGATVETAIREYHGGPDRRKWKDINNSYYSRVSGGMSGKAPAPTRQQRSAPPARASALQPLPQASNRLERAKQRAAPQQTSLDNVYSAYQSGKMSPAEAKEYERDVSNGAIMLRDGQALKNSKPTAQQSIKLPQGVADAYYSGKMSPTERRELERDRDAGLVSLPTPTNMQSSLPDFDAQGQVQQTPETYAGGSIAKDELSAGQKLIGAGEAALTLGTGLVGGILGAGGGALAGAGREMLAGEFGTPEAAERIAQTSGTGAKALTYEPRAQGGQRAVQALGEMAEDTGLTTLPPVLGAGLGTATATLGRANLPAVAVGADKVIQTAKPIVTGAVDAVKSGAAKAKDMMPSFGRGNRNSNSSLDHMGAAAVDDATRRITMANELPYPLGELHSRGTATRDPQQLKFEAETAKVKAGEPLVTRVEERHAGILHNMDSFNESTGADLFEPYAVGEAITGALKKEYMADKARTRAAYAAAEKSSEATRIVNLDRKVSGVLNNDTTLAAYLNGTVEGATETIIPTARKLAEHHGLANIHNGKLYTKPATIKQLEDFRKDITAKVNDRDGADLRQASIIKQLVDGHTAPYLGTLYAKARKARTEQAQKWERDGILDKVMGTKRGTDDRKTALEDVVETIVKRGSKDDVDTVRYTLLTSGVEGKQAFNELKGAVVRDIQKAATSGVAPDAKGNPMVSPAALNKAILAVDDKLDAILGKQQADKLRLLNDISKDLLTLPASAAVNHSNTSSALLAAIDLTTSAVTGLPAPAATALKAATNHLKNRKLKQRVQKALNLDNINNGGF